MPKSLWIDLTCKKQTQQVTTINNKCGEEGGPDFRVAMSYYLKCPVFHDNNKSHKRHKGIRKYGSHPHKDTSEEKLVMREAPGLPAHT